MFNHDENDIDRFENGRRAIGRFIFRNEANQMNHTRNVAHIEDFLARIGGLFGIIIAVFKWLFGDYVTFEAKLRWIRKFYKFEPNFPN